MDHTDFTLSITPEADKLHALAALFLHEEEPGAAELQRMSEFVQRHQVDMTHMYEFAGIYGKRYLLMMPMPGRTGMLFFTGMKTRAEQKAMLAMFNLMRSRITDDKINILQTLIEPGRLVDTEVLHQAGYQHIADLAYMQRSTPNDMVVPHINETVTFINYSDQRHQMFSDTIEATYEQTLDCPRLRGMRPMKDVIDSHMAVGEFDPSSWELMLINNEPAGVCLMGNLPDQDMAELVYLGLLPQARGYGYGKVLLSRGFHKAVSWNRSVCVLAVDKRNLPAMNLYQSLGFYQTGTKSAWLRHVK